jgi:hypothetical protein
LLASAVTLTAMAAALATGSTSAQAALSHRPGTTTPDTIAAAALATGSTPAQEALNRLGTAAPGTLATESSLLGVSALSPGDAWAGGTTEAVSGGVYEVLASRWTGSAWKRMKCAPPVGAQSSSFSGMSVVSPKDVWAAGQYYTGVSGSGPNLTPLIMRWDGTACKRVKSPNPSGSYRTFLNGVSADAPNDAWVAGYYAVGNAQGQIPVPLIEHWNGTAWKIAKTPPPGANQEAELWGVSAVSPKDVWAVGYSQVVSVATPQPLILHWNGAAWKKVKVPSPSGATSTRLNGVSADSPNDAWAVGTYASSAGVAEPLLMHWNGTAWKLAKSPAPSGNTLLNVQQVSADSPKDAWADGWYRSSSGVYEPLLLHWNGTAWKLAKSPVPHGDLGTQLWGVSADSPKDAWATGFYAYGEGEAETLILHWNGTAWKPVKSPKGV